MRQKKLEQFKTDGTLLIIECAKNEIVIGKIKSFCNSGVDLTVFDSIEDANAGNGSFKFVAFDWIKSAVPYAP